VASEPNSAGNQQFETAAIKQWKSVGISEWMGLLPESARGCTKSPPRRALATALEDESQSSHVPPREAQATVHTSTASSEDSRKAILGHDSLTGAPLTAASPSPSPGPKNSHPMIVNIPSIIIPAGLSSSRALSGMGSGAAISAANTPVIITSPGRKPHSHRHVNGAASPLHFLLGNAAGQDSGSSSGPSTPMSSLNVSVHAAHGSSSAASVHDHKASMPDRAPPTPVRNMAFAPPAPTPMMPQPSHVPSAHDSPQRPVAPSSSSSSTQQRPSPPAPKLHHKLHSFPQGFQPIAPAIQPHRSNAQAMAQGLQPSPPTPQSVPPKMPQHALRSQSVPPIPQIATAYKMRESGPGSPGHAHVTRQDATDDHSPRDASWGAKAPKVLNVRPVTSAVDPHAETARPASATPAVSYTSARDHQPQQHVPAPKRPQSSPSGSAPSPQGYIEVPTQGQLAHASWPLAPHSPVQGVAVRDLQASSINTSAHSPRRLIGAAEALQVTPHVMFC
jgi:hypothetical protein